MNLIINKQLIKHLKSPLVSEFMLIVLGPWCYDVLFGISADLRFFLLAACCRLLAHRALAIRDKYTARSFFISKNIIIIIII